MRAAFCVVRMMAAERRTLFTLPQVAECKTPRLMDVYKVHCLYDEFVRQIN